jgi:SAM-dependent methyltransferase
VLDWIADSYFDHVFSFAAIFHFDTRACHVVQECVRIVRPGGTLFLGWFNGNVSHTRGKVPRDMWEDCLSDRDVDIQTRSETWLYPKEASMAGKDLVSRTNSYALILRKHL